MDDNKFLISVPLDLPNDPLYCPSLNVSQLMKNTIFILF